MNDNGKAIDKLHDSITKAHKSLEKNNPDETLESIGEFILHQGLDHYSARVTKEAIISFLSFYRRRDYEDFKAFVDRINKML